MSIFRRSVYGLIVLFFASMLLPSTASACSWYQWWCIPAETLIDQRPNLAKAPASIKNFIARVVDKMRSNSKSEADVGYYLDVLNGVFEKYVSNGVAPVVALLDTEQQKKLETEAAKKAAGRFCGLVPGAAKMGCVVLVVGAIMVGVLVVEETIETAGEQPLPRSDDPNSCKAPPIFDNGGGDDEKEAVASNKSDTNKLSVLAQNKRDGTRRELIMLGRLTAKYNQCEGIWRERYLRNSAGVIMGDPGVLGQTVVSKGEGRRIDFAVVDQNGFVKRTLEVTGPLVDKTKQLQKEARIVKSKGTFVRKPRTKGVVALPNAAAYLPAKVHTVCLLTDTNCIDTPL